MIYHTLIPLKTFYYLNYYSPTKLLILLLIKLILYEEILLFAYSIWNIYWII